MQAHNGVIKYNAPIAANRTALFVHDLGKHHMTFKSALITSFSIIALSQITLTAPAFAADAPASAALKTQAQAQETLDRAIAAAGGEQALKALRQGSITLSVRGARIGQGLTPDSDSKLGNASKTIGRRANGLTAIDRFNGENLGSRYIRGGLVDWIHFTGQNTVADVEASLAAGIIDQANSSAHVLLDLSDNAENLRGSGTARKNGKRYKTLSYANSLGQQETLYFDRKSGHLAAAERLTAHAQWGDTVMERRFSDYKNVNGVMIAHKVETYQGGNLAGEITLEAVSSDAVDSAIFEKPEDATVNDPFTAPSRAPRDLEVETLGDDVYFIANAAQGYNVIFVKQEDGILIIETPLYPQATRDVLRAIKAKFPDTPVKAAVPTHHHFDHSGGLYGLLEAGVPILTTPGNVEFVKSVGTADRRIGSDRGKASNISVSSFDGQISTGSGANRVELINVGPNPHAEEIVIAYIPSIKGVFVADIFSRRSDELPAANANQLAFADRLDALNLDIETFFPVHGTRASKALFDDSVRRGRAAAASDAE